MLNGDFATYKNCTIGIPFSSESDLIYSVSVLFPTMDKWSDLETNYSSIKRMLTTKYGDPTECVEQFHSFYQPTDDNMKMYELSMDRCEYRAVFKPKGGVISLSLVYQPILGASVILNYMDETNANAILSNAMDDL